MEVFIFKHKLYSKICNIPIITRLILACVNISSLSLSLQQTRAGRRIITMVIEVEAEAEVEVDEFFNTNNNNSIKGLASYAHRNQRI